MSRHAESSFKIVCRRSGPVALHLLLVLCGAAALAATAVEPAAGQSFLHNGETPAPKVEIFGGYSYLYPHATATGYLPNGIVPVSTCLCSIPDGGGGSITFDINPWLGVTAAGSAHVGSKSGTPAQTIGTGNAFNFAVGPQFKLRHHHISPFVETLVGGDILSPSVFPSSTALGVVAGGGLDVGVGPHIAVRVFQLDVIFSHHTFAPSPVAATNEVGLQAQAGVVFSFGGAPAAAPIAPAAVLPAVVAPAVVAAAAPAPAPVAAPVEELTLTAQASPSSIVAGESSTITANGVSSLGRPLTYSYSSTIGTISGTAATAVLTTAGASAGTAIVTVSVFDDMNQTAVATVPVVLETPAKVLPVVTSNLCSMSFARDVARPARVDNEAKACLDGIAMTMQHNSDAQLALVGTAAPREPHHDRLAAERAEHTKAYLVKEKGIDASRIQVFTGRADSKVVSSTLVPAGATLDTSGLSPVGPH